MRSLCLLVLVLTVGCVSSGTQVKDSALTQFQKGVTTEADVEHALGAPQSTMILPDGTHAISYAGSHAQPKAASYIPVVGLFAGGVSGQVSVVTFRFDGTGRLIDYTSTQSNVGAATGFAAGYQAPAPSPAVVK